MMVRKATPPEAKPSPTLERLTVCLDQQATADLATIATVCERKTGVVPSRSQVIRAALRAYCEAVQ